MPKNTVSDPITGQEMAFAHLVLSGTMNDRRVSLTRNQPAAPPATAQIYTSEWRRAQQHQAEGPQPGDDPGDNCVATKVQAAAARSSAPEFPPQPAPKPANKASSLNLDRNHPSALNPFVNPAKRNWDPAATGSIFDAVMDATNSFRSPFSSK